MLASRGDAFTRRHKYVDGICESSGVFRQPKRSRGRPAAAALFLISPYARNSGLK